MVALMQRLFGQFLAEFTGTLLLALLATGASASMSGVFNDGIPSGSIFESALATGLALMAAIFVSGGVSGGHVNPAVTLAQAVFGKCAWYQVPVYMLAQYMGAFAGRFVFYLAFVDQFQSMGAGQASALFAAFPPSNIPLLTLIYTDLLASALLMLLICVITNEKNLDTPSYLYPIFIGLSLSSIIMCLARSGGGGVNPAMDFSGRVFAFILGDMDAFSHANFYFWIPILMPHVGAALGALVHFLAVKPFTPKPLVD